jgi:hypothetical protein
MLGLDFKIRCICFPKNNPAMDSVRIGYECTVHSAHLCSGKKYEMLQALLSSFSKEENAVRNSLVLSICF